MVEHDEDTIRTADWIVDIGPGAGEHGGKIVHSGSVQGLLANKESPTGAYLSGRRSIPTPAHPPAADAGPRAGRAGRARAQPAQPDRRLPARAVHRGHRGQRLGQVDAGQRHPLHGAGQPDQRRPDGARPAHPDHRAGARRQGRRGGPVADRADPAVQPGDLHRGLRQHPQAVRRDHRGQGPRVRPGPVLVQRQGRPLRELRRRRHDQDRDELPAGRLRPVRGLQGRPVQPGDARGALQGQDHLRGAGDADRGGGRVLRGDPGDPPAPARPWSTSASATSGWASRRRPCPAARRSASSSPPSCRSAPPAGRCTCSTSRPPACTSRTSASC